MRVTARFENGGWIIDLPDGGVTFAASHDGIESAVRKAAGRRAGRVEVEMVAADDVEQLLKQAEQMKARLIRAEACLRLQEQGWSIAAIAAKTELGESTVKTNLRDARDARDAPTKRAARRSA